MKSKVAKRSSNALFCSTAISSRGSRNENTFRMDCIAMGIKRSVPIKEKGAPKARTRIGPTREENKTQDVYSQQPNRRPQRTMSVFLLAARSLFSSRRLLAMRREQERSPGKNDAMSTGRETVFICKKKLPQVATGPKNRKTKTSPKPKYPRGFGPPV